MRGETPNFDRIARLYETLEHLTLGHLLERTRLHFLSQLLSAHTALVFGDGDGRFLSELLAANPGLHATAVDTSVAMLRLLRERCAPYEGRLRVCQTNALSHTPLEGECYDLVVTHFFLDCLTQSQLDQLAQRVRPVLASGAIWLVSDFHVPAGPLRIPAQLFIGFLYLAFRALTGLRTSRLPDHETSLGSAGFTCIARQQFLGGLLITELWQMGSR